MFPFGSGAGGNVDGYSTMLHRALQPYEMFVQAEKKPFMALMRQSPLQPIVDCIQDQLEQGYLDVAKVVAFNDKLCDLTWLYDLWEKRGLVKNNGVMYVLTDAGQFWQVNLTQTTLECVQYLMTGKTGIAVERVAAQDSAKTDTMIQAMKQMAEAMQNMSPEELQAVMKRMQGSV